MAFIRSTKKQSMMEAWGCKAAVGISLSLHREVFNQHLLVRVTENFIKISNNDCFNGQFSRRFLIERRRGEESEDDEKEEQEEEEDEDVRIVRRQGGAIIQEHEVSYIVKARTRVRR